MAEPIVPEGFRAPAGLEGDGFRLRPLTRADNASDLAAWSASISHIRATPGFADRDWPVRPYSLEENAADLRRHEEDMAAGTGFTYSVVDPVTDEVIGCAYFYGPRRPGYDVDVRSWVRADRADMDKPLHDALVLWLARDWPWRRPDYASRP